MMVVVVAAIIFVERGHRRVTVQYAKRVVGRRMYGGSSTHIPLKVNTGGVIPVIFASSILAFPTTIANFFGTGPGSVGEAVGRQLSYGMPLWNLLYVDRHHLLRVLLHGDHLQPGRRRREHAEVRRVRARDPARQADGGVHRHDPDPGDPGGRDLPGADRDPARVPDLRASRSRRSRSSASGSTRASPGSSPRA